VNVLDLAFVERVKKTFLEFMYPLGSFLGSEIIDEVKVRPVLGRLVGLEQTCRKGW
jgi:hypothetical protein